MSHKALCDFTGWLKFYLLLYISVLLNAELEISEKNCSFVLDNIGFYVRGIITEEIPNLILP